MARKASKTKTNKTDAVSERFAWKRELADHNLTEKLGQRIREHREKQGLSLNGASDLTGVPAATLSRVETNKMSPTFPTLIKLMAGLRLSWAELMDDPTDGSGSDISIAMPPSGDPTEVPGYAYYAPHLSSRLNDRIQPVIFDIRAVDVDSAGGLRGHKGYEFCYVLRGTVIMHVEGRAPVELPAGASVLFNCETPHAYVAKARSRPRVLNITTVDPVSQEDMQPFAARLAQRRDAGDN
ncbi:helix-turn-helix domain-containing protein [Sphingomonas sp. CL5.1]|uniref:helix-turn-helix domain-containing protein n=1 Tax=Sphingomonas sp. CL5.1 TaxID=2653203 RepID=UPI001581B82B|nr:XRE family transcriptional regulator [Sphingomonas sp. CL5.1]QKR99887.1 helix-turn-helix domain-containing protein [Sphingomonas sp. CL5.1]